MKNVLIIIFILTAVSTENFAQNVPDNSVTLPSGTTGLASYPKDFNTSPNTAPTRLNVTRSYIPLTPVKSIPIFNSTQNTKVLVNSAYLDGWGRPLMYIQRNNSSTDVVVPFDYRPSDTALQLLPYADSYHSKFQNTLYTEQKNYYNSTYSAEVATAYSKTIGNNAQARPTVRSYAPGKAFAGNNKGTTITVNTNAASDILILNVSGNDICKSGSYAADQLIATTADGENDRRAILYTDKAGRTICKREYIPGSGNSGYLTTYYVYDDLGQLVAMVPPKASIQLPNYNCINDVDKLCFKYYYDEEGNLIAQNTPGRSGLDSMIYDQDARMVISQTPLQRANGVFLFQLYDKKGRETVSGIYKGSKGLDYWRGIANGSTSFTNTYGIPDDQTLEYFIINNTGINNYTDTLADCQIYSYNYYDNYGSWPANLVSYNYSDTLDCIISTSSTIPKPYNFPHGKLVASRTRILDNNDAGFQQHWITTVSFYDEKGRLIQSQTRNIWDSTNWDRGTIQYNFIDKGMQTIGHYNAWQSSNKPLTKIITTYAYSAYTARLDHVLHKVDTAAAYTLSSYIYDDLGRLKTKKLGGQAEIQNYTYNIRGQLIGINASKLWDTSSASILANDSMSFWETLHYETGFTSQRYDGGLTGYKWRAKGAPVMSYGYSYDRAGRLKTADFREFSSVAGGASWNKTNRDYSVSDLSYDENGNLLTMKQRGYDMTMAPATIDDLSYTYDNGNRLTKVEDGTVASPEDDFSNGNSGSTDYTYDADGNLSSDANKGIGNISYNEFDQPTLIVASGDSIKNIYSASGQLLQKTIKSASGTTRYRYWGPLTFKDDSLQYIAHEEGRVRYDSSTYKYDFFVKDHLGNIRTVIESKVTYDTTGYFGGFELLAAYEEESVFSHIGNVRDLSPTYTPGNEYAGWLDGANPDKRIGAALLLHGMAGDAFNLKGYAYYEDTSVANYNTHAPAEEMLDALLSTMSGGIVQGGGEGDDPQQTIDNLLTPTNWDAYETLRQMNTDTSYPQAYLNMLVFSEDMALMPEYSQVIQAQGTPGHWQLLEYPGNFGMPINGYLLTYFSNGSNTPLAIDNVYAIHYKGKLLKAQHYYPHGLVVDAGNSLNTFADVKFKFQGNEMLDESGVQLFDFNARYYDQQVGRFTAVDPLADVQESLSPYHFCANDPANYVDPMGLTPRDQRCSGEGGGSNPFVTIANAVSDAVDWFLGLFGGGGGGRGGTGTGGGEGCLGMSMGDRIGTMSGPSGGGSQPSSGITNEKNGGASGDNSIAERYKEQRAQDASEKLMKLNKKLYEHDKAGVAWQQGMSGPLLACSNCTMWGDGFWNHTIVGQSIWEGMDWVNHTVNPLYAGFNGVYSLSEKKDFLSGQPMSGAESAVDLLSIVPIGRVSGTASKIAAKIEIRYLEDFVTKNTKNYSSFFKSERGARNLARTKLGKNPIKVGPNKWRSANGKWQYRAKPGDVKDRHIHLEELNPNTGEVLQNYHLRW